MSTDVLTIEGNRYVGELMDMMKQNDMDTRFLDALLAHMSEMERQLERAVDEMVFMRRELNDVRDAADHPLSRTMRNAVQTIGDKVDTTRERLSSLKESIITGCKNALNAVKEKGIVVLNNVAGFFHLKDGMRALGDKADDGVKAVDESIAKIEAVSVEFHEAGMHIANMGRVMIGKEAATEAKPVGKFTKVLEVPLKAERACFAGIRRSAGAAVGMFNRLEQAAGNLSTLKPNEAAEIISETEPHDNIETAVPVPHEVSTESPSVTTATMTPASDDNSDESQGEENEEDQEQSGGFRMAM